MNEAMASKEDSSNPSSLLKLAQKRMSSLIGSLPVGIIIVSPNGEIEAVNPAVLSLLEYEENQLFGSEFNQLFKDAPWGLDLSSEALPSWFADQEKASVEVEVWTKYREIVHVDLSIEKFETGGAPRTLAILVDASERYLATQLKNEFLSLIIHDIRIPLSGVRIFLELLEGKPEYGTLTEKGLTQLRQSVQNVDRIVMLAGQLLDIEKLESGLVSLKLEKVSIEAIITESLNSVSQLADSKSISLSHDCAALNVECDRLRITQVLVNLLANAIDHSPEGSSIEIKTRREEHSLTVEIVDQGPGIPEFEKSKIFDRFKQGKAGLQRAKGHGLGLAISKHIIELHSGEIGVKDNPSGGSIFWFALKVCY